MNAQLNALQKAIDYHFKDEKLLLEALTHPSYNAENKESDGDNQRLEYLGDAVLELAITKRLYISYPALPEGELTKIRAVLSKESTFAQFARMIELGDFIRLGHGEKINKGFKRDSTLCDAFEALIGAIYLDNDCRIEGTEGLINKLIEDAFEGVELSSTIRGDNPKGALQEWSQKRLKEIPVYEIIDVSGPGHCQTFTVGVYFQEQCYGVGKAGKRQAAEEGAAKIALNKLKSGDKPSTDE